MPAQSVMGIIRRRVRTGKASAHKKAIPPVFQRLSAQKCTWKTKLKPLFTRQLATEEFARGFASNPLVCERERLKAIRGPGYYEPIDHTYKESITAPNKGFTTSLRSSLIRKQKYPYPSPGTYLPDIFKDSSVIKKSPSKKPAFQWSIHKSRFKPELSYKWRQCPTLYKPNDVGSIETLLKKRVSTRGPYDLFTGPRDYSSIKNHFCQKSVDAPDKVYDVPNSLDYLLKHPRKKNYGVVYRKAPYTMKDFFRDRYSLADIYRKGEYPGPATYNLTSHTIKPKPHSKVAFNSTAPLSRATNVITPGPGRYFLTRQKQWPTPYGQATIHSKYMETGQNFTIVKTRNLKRLKKLERELKSENVEDEELKINHPTELQYTPQPKKSKPRLSLLSEKYSFMKLPFKEVSMCKAGTHQPLKYSSWHVVPTAIQSLLLQHPAVDDVIIVGFPRYLNDENPFALVTLRKNVTNVTERALLEYLNNKLAYRDHIQGGLVIVKDADIIRTASGRLTASTITTTISQKPKSTTSLVPGQRRRSRVRLLQ